MKILAIETSHDDTSIALYEDKRIIKEITMSQTDFHKQFGGTVPEFAARRHADNLGVILKQFINEFDLSTLDHIAFTKEPGLLGSLHMGRLVAYGLGFSLGKPVYPVNHMHAHIFAVGFTHEIIFPAIALIVSGGHTQLWHVKSVKDIDLLGETKDDAVGEVFDKIARSMGIGFPGGPLIDKLAKESTSPANFDLTDDGTYDMSFSGIKTKIINYVHNKNQTESTYSKADVSKGFQNAITKILVSKTKRAIEQFNPASIILGGGVAANSQLREEFAKIHENALIPELKYTTDNASMIAITSDLLNNKKTS